ncbi:MAG: nucleotidyltransferase family protein [Alphaproteobacteria bacterium]
MTANRGQKSGKPRIGAIILAAGSARRMGGSNKLLARFNGVPLVRRVVEAAIGSSASPVVVVTGARADAVTVALNRLDVQIAHNAAHETGMASSLAIGIGAVALWPETIDGALIVLADMPHITTTILDQIISAFDPAGGKTIIVPTSDGKRGNPVLWGRTHFAALAQLTGDTGARHLIAQHPDAIAFVEVGEAVAIDVDTPDAIRATGGVLPD